MTTELQRLAERCEKATGPDRELDAAIAEAVGCAPGLAYTASLDAAMSLVPHGYAWVVYWDGYAGVDNVSGDDLPQVEGEQCANPILALCAAALRSRSVRGEGEA